MMEILTIPAATVDTVAHFRPLPDEAEHLIRPRSALDFGRQRCHETKTVRLPIAHGVQSICTCGPIQQLGVQLIQGGTQSDHVRCRHCLECSGGLEGVVRDARIGAQVEPISHIGRIRRRGHGRWRENG